MITAILLAGGITTGRSVARTSYESEIAVWRNQREASLKSEGGWLSVAGLFWLRGGVNTAGTGPGVDISLPEGSAPANAGSFELKDGHVRFHAAESASFTLRGKSLHESDIRDDSSDSPDVIETGRLKLILIKRGERFGIRLKDSESISRRRFTGLRWYGINRSYCIKARFIPYDKPSTVSITNIIGDRVFMESPGILVFNINGVEQRLEPASEDGKLFIMFRDSTSGKSTYGAGRFLYADLPENGEVTLDFNKAINPPCAFTRYATCPLPPRQNWLKVPIEAGELAYH